MDKIIGDNSAKSREGNPLTLHLRQANTPVNKIPQKWKKTRGETLDRYHPVMS
jgi:hypothetical protein